MSGESESMSNFYMTQARLPSKVFKLNIGSETVSAQSIIEELIAHQRVAAVPNVNRIIIDPELADKHQSHEFVIREQLNSALLLTLAFYNYAVINKRINYS
uniref:Uncharacterized protein n=1 Tax=Bracon brevicornis TaxID=1563983 RepID=A0A6V7HL25_9HYME